MTERIAVIIVNWNGLEHLTHCLPALMAQAAVAFEVTIVDNGSQDGCVDALSWACFDPAVEECPSAGLSWVNVTPEAIEADYIGGSGLNDKCEGTWEIINLHAALAQLCPEPSSSSFMDFLGPSKAYAACTCAPGIRFSSGRKNYCICF